jgi:uncharacterized membrane protein HdeD (DUF308 family)
MVKKSSQKSPIGPSEVLDKILNAKWGIIFRGVLGVILGYAFLSRAFDTGSWIQYFCALLFTVLGIKILKRYFTNDYGKQVKPRKTR